MKIKYCIIMTIASLVIAGCSSGTEEKSMGEVDKEVQTQELVDDMFSEENLEAAKERLEERGGSDFIVPDNSSIEENEADILMLEESDIAEGEDFAFDNRDNYEEIRAEELGMSPGYYSKHYSMLWTSAIPTYGFDELGDGTISFHLEKYSMFVECYFQSINSDVKEKIIRNLEYAHENEIPVIVYGEFEEYIDDEGYFGHRLVVHRIVFEQII